MLKAIDDAVGDIVERDPAKTQSPRRPGSATEPAAQPASRLSLRICLSKARGGREPAQRAHAAGRRTRPV